MLLPAILFLAIMVIVPLSYSQIGEVAGHLDFSVQVGHNETLQWTILNFGSNTITVSITPPPSLQLTSNASTANQPLPTYSVSQSVVVVPPGGSKIVNVTVTMPLNDTPNFASWEGILSAVTVSNSSNPGGANIEGGVAKIFSIVAVPSTTTTIVSEGFSLGSLGGTTTYIVIGALVVVIIAIIAYYLLKGRKPYAKKQKPAPAGKRQAQKRPARSGRRTGTRQRGSAERSRLARLEAENRKLRQQIGRGRATRRRTRRR